MTRQIGGEDDRNTNRLPARGSLIGLFADTDFRRLWLAGTISSAVRWLDALTFSVVAYQQSGSAFTVAMLLMLRLLPMGLFGAALGAWAEGVQRRSVLLGMMVVMFITAGVLAGLAAAGVLTIWHMAVASFINGIGWVSDSTVRRLALGEVAGATRVAIAVSIDSASANASRMLGPMAGGVLLASIGITGAFVLGAALYLTGTVALAGLRYRNPVVPRGGLGLLERVIGGVRLVRRDPVLQAIMVVTLLFNLFAWPATSMIPVLAQSRLGLGAQATGMLVAMDGLGALLASLAIGTWARQRHLGHIYLGGMILYGAMEIVLGLTGSVWLTGAAVALTGAASASTGILQTTLVYHAAPPDMRSRVFGVLTACIGLGPIGFVHLGLLADWLGAPHATLLVGSEGLVAVLLTRRWWCPLLLPQPVSPPKNAPK